MLLAIRVDLIGELTDNNILFSLLLLYRLLHNEDFLSLRNCELKEEGFVGYRVEHQGSALFFEIWVEEVPESRGSLPLRSWL